jgi:MFS family permease
MYSVQDAASLFKSQKRLLAGRKGGPAGATVGTTVLLLGLVSLLTDISSEMVTTVLPIYLITNLGFTPLQYGFIDGLQRGAAALVTIGGGYFADRTRRWKDVATAGYGLSAISKGVLVVVGGAFSAIGAVVVMDRIGKGIRTAPRDAMITLTTPKENLGAAFGTHRALDTTGAMIGPLLAFAILAVAPFAFGAVWTVSLCFAILGVAVLVLFVCNPRTKAAAPKPPSPRRALGLLHRSGFRTLVVVSAVLSLATISDAFVYLRLQRDVEFDTAYFPLLFTGSALVFMLLAVPVGRLADRIGRVTVFLGGYVLLLGVYALLLLGIEGTPMIGLVLVLLGAFYAATDGVLAAIAGARLPEDLRGSGLGLLGSVTGVARLVGSTAFGALWFATSASTATVVFTVGLVIAVAAGAYVLRPSTPLPAGA